MRLARTVRLRWRPLLAGAILTAAGVMLRGGACSLLFLAGVWAFVYSVLIPEGATLDRNEPGTGLRPKRAGNGGRTGSARWPAGQTGVSRRAQEVGSGVIPGQLSKHSTAGT